MVFEKASKAITFQKWLFQMNKNKNKKFSILNKSLIDALFKLTT